MSPAIVVDWLMKIGVTIFMLGAVLLFAGYLLAIWAE